MHQERCGQRRIFMLDVLFAFDPRRTAILLIGGNKTGKGRWYKEFVPIADRLLYDPFTEVPTTWTFHPRLSEARPGVGFPISRRGWQADGCLNKLAYFQEVESF